METQLIEEHREGTTAVLTINRPQALNALNTSVLRQLDEAVARAADDAAVRVLVLTGAGKAFVAGADIAEMATLDPIQARAFSAFGARVFRTLELLDKPVIAAVNGFALGGGCELAMAADIRLASEKAKFGQPEVGLGIIPGFSGTQRLARLVGVAKAKELIYSGKIIPAAEAAAIGLVNQLYEPEELLPAALELAAQIAAQSPAAVALAKTAIGRGVDLDIETGIELENDLFALCFAGPDQQEGMAAFREKRPAVFTATVAGKS